MINKTIALDIGEKRIGVAISDGLGMLAHPLSTIVWKGIKSFLQQLQEIVNEHQVKTIVVGMPYTLKGTESQKTEQVRELIVQMRDSLNIEILKQDERLTTKMAENALHAVGKKPSKQRNKIDQIAAVYILQSYIDRHSI